MATTGNSKYNFESERLTLPKAAISYDKTGRPIYGLLDVPARRQCGHQFEEAKAVANVEAQDKMLRPQSGQRSAARELMQMEWARREDEAQRKSPRQVVDFYLRTSVDNPLSGIPAANNPLRTVRVTHVPGAMGCSDFGTSRLWMGTDEVYIFKITTNINVFLL
ncbi:hypothetical protein Vretimale_11154 [Volvox reticuliferus]|uniref:Uncharacterized protein n=1 Tax=Volvox reticuliferus TaxID=1737510 RepID=A0A8J4GGR5_9CHLO|nr:hypothetical protein Vretimale_11154 [Volvox reticuliferus]